MVRCIDLTLMSKEKSQSCSEESSTRAMMDKAGAVEQDVDGSERLGERVDGFTRADVERSRRGAGNIADLAFVNIGRHDVRSLGKKRFCRGAADAGAGGGQDGDLSFQSFGHNGLLFFLLRRCGAAQRSAGRPIRSGSAVVARSGVGATVGAKGHEEPAPLSTEREVF